MAAMMQLTYNKRKHSKQFSASLRIVRCCERYKQKENRDEYKNY